MSNKFKECTVGELIEKLSNGILEGKMCKGDKVTYLIEQNDKPNGGATIKITNKKLFGKNINSIKPLTITTPTAHANQVIINGKDIISHNKKTKETQTDNSELCRFGS